jgi:hypothetical protein
MMEESWNIQKIRGETNSIVSIKTLFNPYTLSTNSFIFKGSKSESDVDFDAFELLLLNPNIFFRLN